MERKIYHTIEKGNDSAAEYIAKREVRKRRRLALMLAGGILNAGFSPD